MSRFLPYYRQKLPFLKGKAALAYTKTIEFLETWEAQIPLKVAEFVPPPLDFDVADPPPQILLPAPPALTSDDEICMVCQQSADSASDSDSDSWEDSNLEDTFYFLRRRIHSKIL